MPVPGAVAYLYYQQSSSRDLVSVNIVRDCWWLLPSGTGYLTDENNQFSSYSHGLYKSLNTDDNQYININGTGTIKYIGRLESSNEDVETVCVNMRAAGSGIDSTYLYINSREIGSFDSWGGVETQSKYFDVSNTHKTIIHNGRINNNYDYFEIRFDVSSAQSVTPKLYNLEISYSGQKDWDNHEIGLPNVETSTYYPNRLSFTNNATWKTYNDSDIYTSGVQYLSDSSDDTFIECINPPDHTKPVFGVQHVRRAAQMLLEDVPNGGMSLYFDMANSGLDPITQVTRAQINLEMSLPQSGLHENARDTFEINGFNYLFKEQDYKDEMPEAIGSIRSKNNRFGYFLYGAGDIVEQSGFKNYAVELNFIDPSLSNGDYSSTRYRNIDVVTNTEFQLVGLPSGTQVSSANLVLEYIPNSFSSLYTLGNVHRKTGEGEVDTGGVINPFFGNGGWHHRGDLNEGTIFDAFYDFSEKTGSTTYPITINGASGVVGEYINVLPDDVYDPIILVEPERKNYYRNPISSGDFSGTLFKPTRYRDVVYNTDSSDSTVTQVYFDDRIALDVDFTLYFVLYRQYTTDVEARGRFFHRGIFGEDGETSYELMGTFEQNKVKFSIMDSYSNVHTASVDLPNRTVEPLLIWVTCEYNENSKLNTLSLNVHLDSRTYFYNDWLNDEVQFLFRRRQISEAKTILGSLYIPEDEDEQVANNCILKYISFVEFAWANECLDFEYQTSVPEVILDYDISDDDSKKFLASRVCNGSYLTNGSGIVWSVANGSGLAQWNTIYSIDDWLDDDYYHSLFNPITTAGTNLLVHPSAIYVEIETENDTDHPSGVYIDCDIEFDSGATDNWKVFRSSFNIPSGNSTNINGFSKHIGMYEDSIKYSDVDTISLNLRTKYVDIGSQEYYADLKIKSVKVYFDSYCVAATGYEDLTLYTHGTASTYNDDVDLFTKGFVSSNNNLDLYIYGLPHSASGDFVDLYTYAEHYVEPPYGDLHRTKLNLFIDGLTPIGTSGDITAYMWATPSGVGGIYKSMNLITGGIGKDSQLPLFIRAPIGEYNTSLNLYLESHADLVNNITNPLDLFIPGPSSTTNTTYLYIRGLGTTDGAYPHNANMPLFMARDSESVAKQMSLYLAQHETIQQTDLYISGNEIASSSIPLYIYGSGIGPNNSLDLYTHGF